MGHAPTTTPRRVIAVGIIRNTPQHTTRITATSAGVTTLVKPRAARQCPTCNGRGGHIEDTSADGVTRQTWHTCGDCRGTGVAR